MAQLERNLQLKSLFFRLIKKLPLEFLRDPSMQFHAGFSIFQDHHQRFHQASFSTQPNLENLQIHSFCCARVRSQSNQLGLLNMVKKKKNTIIPARVLLHTVLFRTVR